MFTFKELQDEIKIRAVRNQAGTYFDETIKNVINTSLLRIAREAKWRCLRRKTTFNTVASYISGSNYVTVTNSSTAVTISATACDWWTDKIEVGRYIKVGSSGWYYTIKAINSNTTLTLDIPYRGTTATNTTYEIYPTEEYNLPLQADHRTFLWHEDFGYPYRMFYVPAQAFVDTQVNRTYKNSPTHYRMWGEDTVINQVPTSTPLSLISSNSSDTAVQVTVFGIVSGYPNYETVTLSGTTNTNTTSEFTNVERVAKDSLTYGKVTVTSSRGSYTIAVLPAGDTTASIKYSKIQVYPLPYRSCPINVYYYKDPYRLVNDDDIHELGQEFDEALILLSVSKIKFEDSQAEGDRWFNMYKDELENLRKYNVDKIDWTPILKRPMQDRTDPFVVKNLLYRQAGPNFGPANR